RELINIKRFTGNHLLNNGILIIGEIVMNSNDIVERCIGRDAQGGTTIPPVHEPRRDNDADFSICMLQYFANDFFEVAGTFYGGRAGSTGPERKVTEQV